MPNGFGAVLDGPKGSCLIALERETARCGPWWELADAWGWRANLDLDLAHKVDLDLDLQM